MSTIEEIKTAIGRLTLEDRAEMLAELCGWTDDEWDRQMKHDAKAGKFSALNREADAAHFARNTHWFSIYMACPHPFEVPPRKKQFWTAVAGGEWG